MSLDLDPPELGRSLDPPVLTPERGIGVLAVKFFVFALVFFFSRPKNEWNATFRQDPNGPDHHCKRQLG